MEYLLLQEYNKWRPYMFCILFDIDYDDDSATEQHTAGEVFTNRIYDFTEERLEASDHKLIGEFNVPNK